jgi:hypothetical protein
MTTLYYRGGGHLGPESPDHPSTINFIPGDYVDGYAVGYATITDADPYRAEKLAMIEKYGPGLGIVAVESIPAKAPTVTTTPAPTFRTPTVADGWHQYR